MCKWSVYGGSEAKLVLKDTSELTSQRRGGWREAEEAGMLLPASPAPRAEGLNRQVKGPGPENKRAF